MAFIKKIYPRTNFGSITGSKLFLENELVIGDIHIDSVEEPGMIKWDGTNFLGYTGTTGWVNLDLTSETISAPGSNGDLMYNNNGSLDGFGNWDGTLLSLDVDSSGLTLLSANSTSYTITIDNSGNILINEIAMPLPKTFYENDIVFTDRNNLNIITNGVSVLTDVAVNDETEFALKFAASVDVDLTGITNGDVLNYNSGSTKIEPTQTAPIDLILNSVEANISSDGIISIIIPAGYRIDSITISEIAGNAAGDISLGSTDTGDDIVSNFTVSANDDELIPLDQQGVTFDTKTYFSRVNDTDIYISSSAWGTGIVELYFTMKKI